MSENIDLATRLKIVVLFLDSLLDETLSPEVLALAGHKTRTKAQQLGYGNQAIDSVMGWILARANERRLRNPISGMF